jgi:hypothetical protein
MTSKWIQGDRFQNVEAMIKGLCRKYDLPIPLIYGSTHGEVCDFTSPQVIRLFVENDDVSYDEHARHVFSHYLCNLEQTEHSDRVVEIIMENI